MLKQNPESFGSSYAEAINHKHPIKNAAERLSHDGNCTFGCFSGNQLVGAVTMVREKGIKMNHKASIYAMYVNLSHRGQGVGRGLMESAVNRARKTNGIEQLLITVVTTNETARGLYHSCGFKPYGTEKRALKYNGEYYDEELMVLFL
ncbi:GNAT family N-acetyltransferase [Bacillus sp. NTK074B]|nr:GNAT family N-acetyltransferase [Bacillus sp. NTK074B]